MMKKTYISPAAEVCICQPRELMIGAMDQSDPTFKKPDSSSNETSFDEDEDGLMSSSSSKLWDE